MSVINSSIYELEYIYIYIYREREILPEGPGVVRDTNKIVKHIERGFSKDAFWTN